MISGVQTAVLQWLANGETGLSSETLAFWAAFDVVKHGRSYPHDPADFNRCLGLFEAAPSLRPRLKKMRRVSPVWERLVDNWDEIEKTFRAEVGPVWSKNRLVPAPLTYALMQQVIDGVPTSAS